MDRVRNAGGVSWDAAYKIGWENDGYGLLKLI